MSAQELVEMETTIHRVEGAAHLVSLVSDSPQFEGEGEMALTEISRNLLAIHGQLMKHWHRLKDEV